MSGLETAMVLGWAGMVMAGLIFQVLYGWPWQSPSELRTMSWHLFLGNLIIWMEPASFLLLSISLWPAVVVLYVSIGIMVWRIAILARAQRKTEEEKSDAS